MNGKYYFKVARTVNIQTYSSPTDIPIDEFFKTMKVNIIRDFGYADETKFEIVQCGQDIPGRDAEDAPAIDINNLFGNVLRNYGMHGAFYIREIVPVTNSDDFPGPPVPLSRYNRTYNEGNATVMSASAAEAAASTHQQGILPTCGICYANSGLRIYYNCMHLFCEICFHECIINDNNICSICRARPL